MAKKIESIIFTYL